jgi:hypothetical protein
MKGPSIKTVPEHSFKSCRDCEYFSRNMVRTGRNPTYESACGHPEAVKEEGRGKTSRQINFNAPYIECEQTPQWCPYSSNNNIGYRKNRIFNLFTILLIIDLGLLLTVILLFELTDVIYQWPFWIALILFPVFQYGHLDKRFNY